MIKQTGWLSNYLKKTMTTQVVNVIALSDQSSARNSETATLNVVNENVTENEMEVGITVTENEEEVVSLAASNFVLNTSSSRESNTEASVVENRFNFDDSANWPNVIDECGPKNCESVSRLAELKRRLNEGITTDKQNQKIIIAENCTLAKYF